MKDTEIIQKLQKQHIETQQKRSKMNELIIRNNENDNYLSDKMIEGLFGLINPRIKFFEERIDAYTVDLVYDYRPDTPTVKTVGFLSTEKSLLKL